MQKKIIILLLLSFLSMSLSASVADVPKVKKHKNHLKNRFKPLKKTNTHQPKSFFKLNKRTATHNKWIAAGLDVTLGLFGVHRLYLGTEAHVPVMYTLTLGGGGILILADLGLLIFTKDVETFSGNSRIFMWSE